MRAPYRHIRKPYTGNTAEFYWDGPIIPTILNAELGVVNRIHTLLDDSSQNWCWFELFAKTENIHAIYIVQSQYLLRDIVLHTNNYNL